MKVVYSPNIAFAKNKSLFRYMFKHFNLDQDQVMNLQRNDLRLIKAVEDCREQAGGISSLITEELKHNSPYNIVGEHKEMLVIGLTFTNSLLKSINENLILHLPVTLESADLTKPCIYERSLGVLYVLPGSHEIVIFHLLQQYLKMNSVQVQNHLEKTNMTASDYFLKHYKSACFRSSSSTKISIFSTDHLSTNEYDILKCIGFDEILI